MKLFHFMSTCVTIDMAAYEMKPCGLDQAVIHFCCKVLSTLTVFGITEKHMSTPLQTDSL